MSATRTLAVSSGLGALFLLHGCGDKTPVVEAPADQADVVVPDAVDADGDVAPPPVSSSGNWGDVVNYIAEKRLTRGGDGFKNFRSKFEKSVTVDASSEDEMFDSSAASNTISVILNDWNHKETGCAKTSKNFAKAFFNEKKDTAEIEIDIRDFGQFHQIIESHRSTYVADPAQITLSDQSKWTKAVFFALDKEDNDVWIRSDDDKKKANATQQQLRPMNMVVVFTADDVAKYPYMNRNNFAMAVVNPKDASSPVDVFKASMKTFEIVFTVMSAAKKMQDYAEDTYAFEENYKSYKANTKYEDQQALNWWGAYSDADSKTPSEPIETKIVGGQCPEFGLVTRDEQSAIEALTKISKEMKDFFILKKAILKGGKHNKPFVFQDDASGRNNADEIKARDLSAILSKSDSLYHGACKKHLAAELMEEAEMNDDDKKKYNAAVQEFADGVCVPHADHQDSLFWRMYAVAKDTKNVTFDLPTIHCAADEKACLDKAASTIKARNPFNSADMQMVVHTVLYAEFPQYASKVHDIQDAIVEFYEDYQDEEIGARTTDEFQYRLGSSAKLHSVHELSDKFFKTAKLDKNVGNLSTNHDMSQTKLIGDKNIVVPGDLFSEGLISENNKDPATFSVKAPVLGHKDYKIQVWKELFEFLGKYSESDIKKFVPQNKKQWNTSFSKMKVSDELTAEWPSYLFPSERSLSTAQVSRIHVGPQSDQAEINAAIYAGLMLQFFHDFDHDERKKPKFLLATADAEKAKKLAQTIKNGHKEMIGAPLKEMPEIVLTGSAWSDAKAKAESLFSEKKAHKQQGSIDSF